MFHVKSSQFRNIFFSLFLQIFVQLASLVQKTRQLEQFTFADASKAPFGSKLQPKSFNDDFDIFGNNLVGTTAASQLVVQSFSPRLSPLTTPSTAKSFKTTQKPFVTRDFDTETTSKSPLKFLENKVEESKFFSTFFANPFQIPNKGIKVSHHGEKKVLQKPRPLPQSRKSGLSVGTTLPAPIFYGQFRDKKQPHPPPPPVAVDAVNGYSDELDDYPDYNFPTHSRYEPSHNLDHSKTRSKGQGFTGHQSLEEHGRDYHDHHDDHIDDHGYNKHSTSYSPSRKPGPYGYPNPNFKCEYEQETLYVTKTDYKFDKKCFTVYATKCRHEQDTGKGIGFQKHCNEFTVTRCRTEYDTSFEKECKTIYKKQCAQIYVSVVDWDYEEECETIYEEKCYGHGYDKTCEPVSKKKCHQVPVKKEKQVPKTKCKKVPDKKCQDVPKFVPRKACKHFPKKVCTKDPIQVPRKISKKVCGTIPKEVCIKIPVQVLKHVPKHVTKKVCKSTKHGYDPHHDDHEIHPHDDSGYHAKELDTYDFDGVEEVEFSGFHVSDFGREIQSNFEDFGKMKTEE